MQTLYSGILIDDQAIYRRTGAGQGELLAGSRGLSRSDRRVLGMVTGFTELRVLMDMGLDASDLREAIPKLLQLGLIEQISS